MTTITPDEGLDWYRDIAVPANNARVKEVYDIAVGDGSASLSPSDSQLDNELYRGKKPDSNVNIIAKSATGVYEVSITISGGTEVAAGANITELGVWSRDPSIDENNVTDADDEMLYRELRPGVQLESGDRKTFKFTITVKD